MVIAEESVDKIISKDFLTNIQEEINYYLYVVYIDLRSIKNVTDKQRDFLKKCVVFPMLGMHFSGV